MCNPTCAYAGIAHFFIFLKKYKTDLRFHVSYYQKQEKRPAEKNNQEDMKMEKREQLMNGLNYVREMVHHMVELSNQELDIEESFLEKKNVTEFRDFSVWRRILKITTILAVIGLFAVGSLMRKDYTSLALVGIGGLVFFVKRDEPGKARTISAICTFGGIAWFLKSIADNGGVPEVLRLVGIFSIPVLVVLILSIIFRNRSAQRQNRIIARYNADLYEEYDRVEAELTQYRQELYRNTKDWYPVDYYTEKAVEWFIWAVQNQYGEDMSTLVRLFETSEYRRQMMEAQQQLIADVNRGFAEVQENQMEIVENLHTVRKQMSVANVLSTMNLCVNLGTQRKIDQQNQMIAAQNRSIADHTAAVNSVRSAVQDNTCAINAYRTQF